MLKLSINDLSQISGGISCVELALLISVNGGLTNAIQNGAIDNQAVGGLMSSLAQGGGDNNFCGLSPAFIMTLNVPPGHNP